MGKSEKPRCADSGKAIAMQLLALVALSGCGARHTALPTNYEPEAARAQPPGGMLATLAIGDYVCALPGDAGGALEIHVPEEDFAIVHASLYRTAGGGGTYLHWGATTEMTSGPKGGERFHSIAPNQLKKLNPDGTEGPLRCTRAVLNNRR